MRKSRSHNKLHQLQNLEPAAWTDLLREAEPKTELEVEAVSANTSNPMYTRYLLQLVGHSDPITLLGKQASVAEASFHQHLGTELPLIAPRCMFSHIDQDGSWVVLQDVPADTSTEDWLADDVQGMVHNLADLHVEFWDSADVFRQHKWLPYYLGTKRRRLGKNPRVKSDSAESDYDQQLSLHAQKSMMGLAPVWQSASKGLNTMLELEGWEGVLEEKHLRAVADLIDDPLPMLHLLRQLPQTIVHGYPGIYNWRVSPFPTRYLVDWHNVAIGPGVCDLVALTETFGLIRGPEGTWQLREDWPLTEETLIDAYIYQLATKLGRQIDTQAIRRALPAAHCLYIITHWFPRFEKWFNQLPSNVDTRRDMWEQISRYSEEELANTIYSPIAGLRPYLAQTFRRFLRHYYQIS